MVAVLHVTVCQKLTASVCTSSPKLILLTNYYVLNKHERMGQLPMKAKYVGDFF